MNRKNFYQGASLTGLLALLFIAALSVNSCDLPEGPGFGGKSGTGTGTPGKADASSGELGFEGQAGSRAGTGTLTLFLPKTSAPARNAAGVSRSVLSGSFVGGLKYRVTVTGAGGETASFEAEGGGTTVSLREGVWTIAAQAYDPLVPGTAAVGSGSVTVTIVTGQNASAKINMTVAPAYEAALTEIYIHNEAELRRVVAGDFAIDGSVDFYLENDIVLDQPWTAIGSENTPFKAKFDGQEHTITVKSFGPAIKETGSNFVYQGFFALVAGAEIKNINVKYELSGPVDIRTGEGSTYYDSWAGGVAGRAEDNTSFENINIEVADTFSIIADGTSGLRVGGIVGDSDGTITDCHVSGTIEGTSANYLAISGIAGMFDSGTVSESSFTGTVNGSAAGNCAAGGIAGHFQSGEISAVYAEGHIKAEADNSDVGGIAGNTFGDITKSYAAGVIEGIGIGIASGSYSNSGGIAGNVQTGGTIENCYAWADVSSSSSYGETAGGIAGTNTGTISKCYAAGKVVSKGHDPYTYVGGIAGDAGAVSGCMALVSELDGGPSTSTSKIVYHIGYSATSFSGGNYALNGITKTHNTASPDTGLNAQDGQGTPPGDFTTPTTTPTTTPYTTAGWDFTAGKGDWQFLSGYDYPVLSWQTEPPGAGMKAAGVDAGIDFAW